MGVVELVMPVATERGEEDLEKRGVSLPVYFCNPFFTRAAKYGKKLVLHYANKIINTILRIIWPLCENKISQSH